jgi:hypothetical protein
MATMVWNFNNVKWFGKMPKTGPNWLGVDWDGFVCSDCRGKAPMDYCPACAAAFCDCRRQERENRRPLQRAQYARRRARVLRQRPATFCTECGVQFKRKRTDARYCSDACRQKVHRKAVTAS